MAGLQVRSRLFRAQKEGKMNTGKILTGTAVGGVVLAIAAYFTNISRAQAQLQVIPTANIHKLSLAGLSIKVDALLKNPTGASFKIKYPFVKLEHKGLLVGSSQVIDKDITIPAYGQVFIEGIMVNIPVLSVFSTAFDLAKSLMNDKPIAFTVGVITTVSLGWKQLAYEHKQELTIKK
jgi:hypothetical protein